MTNGPSHEYHSQSNGSTALESIGCHQSICYLLTLEDVTDHFGRLGNLVAGIFAILSYHPPPGHQNDEVSNIGNVGNGSQGVIHHNFLEKMGRQHTRETTKRICYIETLRTREK